MNRFDTVSQQIADAYVTVPQKGGMEKLISLFQTSNTADSLQDI